MIVRTEEPGLYLFGITRSRGWRARPDEDIMRVRYRDLEAVVRAQPFTMPRLDESAVKQHQRVVEAAMRRTTVLPMPFGVMFRNRRALISFLQDQYLVLDEALSFVDGHWELRLHMRSRSEQKPQDLRESTTQIYTELRRFARAAVPFRAEEDEVLSAAFLVDRGAWIEFVTRCDDLTKRHEDFSVDVTGPWPPYDFVQIADTTPEQP